MEIINQLIPRLIQIYIENGEKSFSVNFKLYYPFISMQYMTLNTLHSIDVIISNSHDKIII